jgi:RNA polymerase sigma-70 factor (ECF subfamily)
MANSPRESSETSLSLLEALQRPTAGDAWQRMAELYGPLIRGWLRRNAILPHDQDDLIQEVLAIVVRKVPAFERVDRPGAFRRWLLNITINCVRDFWRARRLRGVAVNDTSFGERLSQLDDPDSPLSRLWDVEHDRYILERLLELVRPHFELKTWTVFCRITLDGIPPAEAAAEQGLSPNAAFIAKSRVLAKLRELGRGLVDLDG